jgi:hypothetical protein
MNAVVIHDIRFLKVPASQWFFTYSGRPLWVVFCPSRQAKIDP